MTVARRRERGGYVTREVKQNKESDGKRAARFGNGHPTEGVSAAVRAFPGQLE